MEFVKDHAADAFQRGVGLDHPGQDGFGHDLDPASRHRFTADAIPDPPADALAQTMGQTLGCGAGGQSARLQHHDPARDLIQQGQRHPRRLARPRRRDQNRAAMRGQGRAKRRQNVFDGQAVGHPQGYAKAPARAKARAAIYEIARMAPIFGATTKGWQAEWVSAAI